MIHNSHCKIAIPNGVSLILWPNIVCEKDWIFDFCHKGQLPPPQVRSFFIIRKNHAVLICYPKGHHSCSYDTHMVTSKRPVTFNGVKIELNKLKGYDTTQVEDESSDPISESYLPVYNHLHSTAQHPIHSS